MNMLHILLFMGLGWGEIVLVMFVLLLLFGAKKIPELARGLGKGIREFKDATNEIKDEVNKGIDKANSDPLNLNK